MKQYEVALMERVPNSVEDDFESIDYIEVNSYRDAVRTAKMESAKWDACDVMCYCETAETSYWLIFRETYIKGKKYKRIEF